MQVPNEGAHTVHRADFCIRGLSLKKKKTNKRDQKIQQVLICYAVDSLPFSLV